MRELGDLLSSDQPTSSSGDPGGVVTEEAHEVLDRLPLLGVLERGDDVDNGVTPGSLVLVDGAAYLQFSTVAHVPCNTRSDPHLRRGTTTDGEGHLLHRTRTLVALGAASVIAATAIAPSMASAQSDIDELLTGLNSPKGVALLGRTSSSARARSDLRSGAAVHHERPRPGHYVPGQRTVTLIDVAISPVDGTGWGIVGDEDGGFIVVHQLADGSVVEVLDMP